MKKSLYFIWTLVLVIILGATGFFVLQNKTQFFVPKRVHVHAGFVMFANNQKIDFSDDARMHMEPCTDTSKQPSPEEIQMQKAHLHDNIGDVVHVERQGATWRDLFTNLDFSTDFSDTTGYINGQKVDRFQNRQINPYDSIVIFIGENDPQLLNQTVSKKRIQEAEKLSDNCGS